MARSRHMGWGEILSAVGGAVVGAGATLASPWSNWGAERRRLREQGRRDLVANWRAGIDDFAATTSPNVQHLNREVAWLHAQPWFRDFRGHLTDGERATILRTDPINAANINLHHLTVTFGPVEHPTVTAMHAALRRIEKDWKLI